MLCRVVLVCLVVLFVCLFVCLVFVVVVVGGGVAVVVVVVVLVLVIVLVGVDVGVVVGAVAVVVAIAVAIAVDVVVDGLDTILTERKTECGPRSRLTLRCWRTAGTGLTTSVDLLAVVVPSRAVVTDVVLSVQPGYPGPTGCLDIAAPNIPRMGV